MFVMCFILPLNLVCNGIETLTCTLVLRLHYIMRSFTRVSDFSPDFPHVYDINMLVSKTRVKTQEKCKKIVRKIKNASPTRENVSILHYALGTNAIQLRFAHVLLTIKK